MRILVLHWGFPPIAGGVETHLATLLPEMVCQGQQVSILTGSTEAAPERETFEGVEVIRKPELDLKRLLDLPEPEIYSQTKDLFNEFPLDKVDVIHAHNLQVGFLSFSQALFEAIQNKGIPTILVLHNHRFLGVKEEDMFGVMERFDWSRICPVSKFIASRIVARKPNLKEKIQVILHGIDLEKFRPATEQEKEKLKERYGFKERKVIIHPARLGKAGIEKGAVQSIEAMQKIRETFPESLLLFTGRAKMVPITKEDARRGGEIDTYLDDLIEKYNLGENVYASSAYTLSDIPNLVRLSDLLVYPTMGEEAFGLCPVEGMACGLPVIVTRSGGMVESVLDGATGFIIDKDERRTPEQLADKIIQLLSDPAWSKRLGENGRRRTEEVFDKRRMASDFIRLSEELTKD